MRDVLGRNVCYRQEEIEEIFQDIFRSFSFDEVTGQMMKKFLFLWDEHFEKKKITKEKIANLRARYDELSDMINKAYEDKVRGKLAETDWETIDNKWKAERGN